MIPEVATPAATHLDGETEVEFQCGVASDEMADPAACSHAPEQIELEAPAHVDANGRIHLSGRPADCPDCGQPYEFDFNGVRVMFYE